MGCASSNFALSIFLCASFPHSWRTASQLKGLVILRASYGSAKVKFHDMSGRNTDSWEDGKSWADVTIAVQALVHDSQLSIPGGHSKASLFSDHHLYFTFLYFFFSSPFFEPCLGIGSGGTETVALWLCRLNGSLSRCVWGKRLFLSLSFSATLIIQPFVRS